MFHLAELPLWKAGILAAYFGVLLVLSIYGVHRYLLVWLYERYATGPDPEPASRFEEGELPAVTVQLPLYNERYVVERLVEAVCSLDYPTDRLQIQILDDSTDDTTSIARKLVRQKQSDGYDIEVIHRDDRTGYKAGALDNGLDRATGDFVAVFDADFIPDPSFLRDTIHHFTEPDIGMVQARWDYINRDYSLLTKAQAILLDGHFVLEHTARHRSGRFFNFNGTAGIWRREAIEDAGGWEHDTLTEDLDLSYRAQMEGWSFRFLRDVEAPSELPVEMNAFKSQQHRWAKGSLQTAVKLLPRILRSEMTWWQKHEAFYHLTANVAYLLMVVLAALMPMATLIRIQQGWYETLIVDFPIFLSATWSVCYFYWVSQRELGRGTWKTVRLIPVVLAVGIGLSVNNAKAVLEALFGHDSPFVRTPKYAIQADGESWAEKLYIQKSTVMTAVELGLGLWVTYAVGVVVTSNAHSLFALPFLALFQFGFLYVAGVSILQTIRTFGDAPEEQLAAGE